MHLRLRLHLRLRPHPTSFQPTSFQPRPDVGSSAITGRARRRRRTTVHLHWRKLLCIDGAELDLLRLQLRRDTCSIECHRCRARHLETDRNDIDERLRLRHVARAAVSERRTAADHLGAVEFSEYDARLGHERGAVGCLGPASDGWGQLGDAGGEAAVVAHTILAHWVKWARRPAVRARRVVGHAHDGLNRNGRAEEQLKGEVHRARVER
eukprot:1672581-Prymnesium_polylepis.1